MPALYFLRVPMVLSSFVSFHTSHQLSAGPHSFWPIQAIGSIIPIMLNSYQAHGSPLSLAFAQWSLATKG